MTNPFKTLLHPDRVPLTFGKYAGQTPTEISQHDPGYIVWMGENIINPPCSDALIEECMDHMDEIEEILYLNNEF